MGVLQATFTKPTGGTTNQITGISFIPKAVYMFTASRTATGSGVAGYWNNYIICQGVTDFTNKRSMAHISRSTTAALETGTLAATTASRAKSVYDKTNVLPCYNNAGTLLSACSSAAVSGAGPYTLTFTWSNTTEVGIIHVLIIGGGAGVDCRVGSSTFGTAVGTANYTIGGGWAGNPDGLIAFAPGEFTSDIAGTDASIMSYSLGFGAGPQATPTYRNLANRANSAVSPTVSHRRQVGTSFLSMITSTGTLLNDAALATTWPANGFALTTAVSPGSPRAFFYLAIQGMDVAVGADTFHPVAATPRTTSLSFAPEGLILSSWHQISQTVILTGTRAAIGIASDETGNESHIWASDEAGVTTVNADRRVSTTLVHVINNSPGSGSVADIDLVSMANGVGGQSGDGFTMTPTGGNGFAYQFNYMALREAGASSQDIAPALLTNTPSYLQPVVSAGGLALAPDLLTNAPSYFAPTLTLGTAAIAPAKLTNTPTFFAPSLAVGNIGIAPALHTNTPTFFAPTVTAASGAQAINPVVFTNTPTIFVPALTRGTVNVAPAKLNNVPTYFTPAVTAAIGIAPAKLSNSPTYFAPSLTLGTASIAPALLTNTPTFFAVSVAVAGQTETWLQYDDIVRNINPANHPAGTLYQLEATLWAEAAGNPAKVRLMYLVGATWTAVPGAPTVTSAVVLGPGTNPASSGTSARVRSAAFSLVAGGNDYRFERSHIAGTVHHYESCDIRAYGGGALA